MENQEVTISIGDTAKELGVSVKTVRRWADAGKLRFERSPSGHRRFFLTDIKRITPRDFNQLEDRITINYARVSSHDQKDDLSRQIKVLEAFSGSNGWQFETISDLGSGLNYNKKGLQKLLKRIMQGDVGRLVLTHKDRLLRFGSEIVFAMCEEFETEVKRLKKESENFRRHRRQCKKDGKMAKSPKYAQIWTNIGSFKICTMCKICANMRSAYWS
jgi:excisionase family DNA binding protein